MKGKWSPSATPMPGNMATSPYPSTRSGQSCLLSLSHYLGHKGRGAHLPPKNPVSIQSLFLRERGKEGGMPKKETEYATAAMDQVSLPLGHCRPSISLTGLQQQAKPAAPKAGPTYCAESSLHRFPGAPTFSAHTGATPSRSLPTGPN